MGIFRMINLESVDGKENTRCFVCLSGDDNLSRFKFVRGFFGNAIRLGLYIHIFLLVVLAGCSNDNQESIRPSYNVCDLVDEYTQCYLFPEERKEFWDEVRSWGFKKTLSTISSRKIEIVAPVQRLSMGGIRSPKKIYYTFEEHDVYLERYFEVVASLERAAKGNDDGLDPVVSGNNCIRPESQPTSQPKANIGEGAQK